VTRTSTTTNNPSSAQSPPAAAGRPAHSGVIAPACIAAALLAMVALILAAFRFADHDMFHQMALAKAAIELGHVPRDDLFAFTPTLSPVVHHEWGMGFILHGLWQLAGLHAVAALRIMLVAAILALTTLTARRRGASWGIIAATMPLGLLFLSAGISPVRAQLFTLVFLAAQLLFMDLDRRGIKWWVPLWLLLLIPWLNIHGGFVVGPAILALHWLEQVARTRKPQWHLIAAGLAAVPLMLINPYGTDFVRYLFSAVTMPRGLISEWAPLWTPGLRLELAAASFSALITLYAALRKGWRTLPGLPVLLAALVESFMHQRHLSILAVVWVAYVPGMLAGTPLDGLLARLWERRRALIAAGAFAATGACLFALPAPPWRVELATRDADAAAAVLPVHAADYLERTRFTGNVLTPFNGSAYLSWRLWPDVKVSLDSRYEAAYSAEVVQDHMRFYAADGDWPDTLEKYNPDLVLTTTGSAIGELLTQHRWTTVHKDEAYVLLAPPD